MLANATATGAGPSVSLTKDQELVWSATLSGTGAVSASWDWQFLDGGGAWRTHIKGSLSGSGAASDRGVFMAPGNTMRVLVTTISGTGATLTIRQDSANGALRTVSPMDFGARFDGVTDDSVALQAAVDAASAAGGGVVQMPAGTSIIGTAIAPKDRVIVRGAGMGATILKQAGSNRVFSRSFSIGNNLEQVGFEDFTVLGLWETTQSLGSDTDRHFSVDGINRLTFNRIESRYCRQMAITAGYCEEITATNCRIIYCARDGFNLTASKRCVVTGNHIRHVSDDAIAIHQTAAAGNPPTEGHVISNNVVEDAFGIKCLGLSKATVNANTLRRVKGYGVMISDEGVEGYNDVVAVAITGNTITDVINANKFGGGDIAHGIFVSGSATSFAAPVVGAATPTITKPEALYYLSNGASAQNAGTQGLVIVGNTIMGATLPASAEYDDWGYGQAFRASGWANPSLASGFHFNANGIRLGGALLSVLIAANHIEFVNSGVRADSISFLGDCVVQGNTFRRYASHGVNLETGAIKYGRALVDGNTFDGDPYLEHANRTAGPDGTWSSGAQQPTAVNCVNFKGVSITSNSFRNLNQVMHRNGTNASLTFDGNTYYLEPNSASTVSSSSNSNKGIRRTDGININGIFVWEDSTPTSATYGQELWRVASGDTATSIPTQGHFMAGMFIRNASALGSGTQTLGWQRLTTGNAHVSGTDWRVLQVTGA